MVFDLNNWSLKHLKTVVENRNNTITYKQQQQDTNQKMLLLAHNAGAYSSAGSVNNFQTEQKKRRKKRSNGSQQQIQQQQQIQELIEKIQQKIGDGLSSDSSVRGFYKKGRNDVQIKYERSESPQSITKQNINNKNKESSSPQSEDIMIQQNNSSGDSARQNKNSDASFELIPKLDLSQHKLTHGMDLLSAREAHDREKEEAITQQQQQHSNVSEYYIRQNDIMSDNNTAFQNQMLLSKYGARPNTPGNNKRNKNKDITQTLFQKTKINDKSQPSDCMSCDVFCAVFVCVNVICDVCSFMRVKAQIQCVYFMLFVYR